jgi:alpha-N-arabinofuranosidase
VSALARARLDLVTEWQAFTGRLEIPAGASPQAEGLFLVSLTTDRPANFVLGRVLLYPDDHVHHADVEIVRMLRDARLSILRWPGGNFVSGYRWRDGVGPPDRRPTMPNPVWHGVFESNLFGTDEFLAYCRAVGCEPLICVNAGDGTAEEAAEWVEYCNGSTDTPMGRLRAENGHPAPYRVHYWEIGNEIFGRHQIGWTTPGGNVDRFLRFAGAMKAADPSIRLLACGGLHLGVDAEWNQRLIRDTHGLADCQTHHILEGGEVGEDIDVKELYHAFLAYPIHVGRDYRRMRQRMADGGIAEPRLAITEMQLFASYKGRSLDGRPLPGRMPTPSTIAEALYAALFLHQCIRLGDLVELFTHTGTVNHGGGLRKSRQRVWANPVHYAYVLESDLGGRIPVAVELSCGTYSTEHAFGHLPVMKDVPNLDALAALSPDGEHLDLLLVHRSACCGPVELTIDLGGFAAASTAEVLSLRGDGLDDENTIPAPRKVAPTPSQAPVASGRMEMTLPPYSLTRIRFRQT